MRRLNFILDFVLIGICGMFYYMTSQLTQKASVYPTFVISLLLILTLIDLVSTLINKEDNEESAFKGIELKQLLTVIAVSGVYVFLINILGYVTSTFAYIATLLILLKLKKQNSILISLGFSLVIYVLFKIILKVPLPRGFII